MAGSRRFFTQRFQAHRPSRFELLGCVTILGGALALQGCQNSADSSVVPVNSYPESASTCSSTPIVDTLYDYADPQAAGAAEYRVTKAAPLRLRFPAVYYGLEPNIHGGPQAKIELKLSSASGMAVNLYNMCRGFHRNLKRADQVDVDIVSNLLGPQSMLRPDYDLIDFSFIRRWYKERSFHDAKPIAGYRAIAYNELSAPVDRNGRESVKPGLLNDANYELLPSNPNQSVVKLIECKKYNLKCSAFFFYRKKQVQVFFDKKDIAALAAFSYKVVRLLDKANLDRAPA